MHDAVVLNEHQRRHFEVLFAGLEQALNEIDELLREPVARQRHLTQYRDDLPANAAVVVVPHVALIRRALEALTKELGLKPRTVSRRQSIRALLTAQAIRIEESYAGHLRGYGSVDASVAQHLDPALASIRESLVTISGLLAPPRGAPRRQD